MIHPDQKPMFRFLAIMTAAFMVGFTIKHIAAVFLPALGGFFWMINYRIPFLAGAVLGMVSLIAAQFMRSHHDPDRRPEAVLPVYAAADTEKA